MTKTSSTLSLPQLWREMEYAQHEVECENCGLYEICRVAGLENNTELLDKIVARRQKVARDTLLFRAGSPFHAGYAVKSGSFKTTIEEGGGVERIVDFHFPGELMGLEAIKSK